MRKLKVIILARDEKDNDYPNAYFKAGKASCCMNPLENGRFCRGREFFDPSRERA